MEKRTPIVKDPRDFDPDEFVLAKDDVLDFIGIVIKFWMRDKKQAFKNIKLIGGLEMMKAGVIFTSEEDFKMIWSMLLQFINQLQYENSMQKLMKEGGKRNFAVVVAKIKDDLRKGGLEKMFARFQK